MPKPNKVFEHYRRQIESSLIRRGYRIGERSRPRPTARTPQSAQTATIDTVVENAMPEVKEPDMPVIRESKPQVSGSAPLRKIHNVYDTLEKRALYLSPVLDLCFSKDKDVNIDQAGTQTTELAVEAYNSVKLFTLLTTIIGDGRMLVAGPPGSGKTSTATYVGSAMFNLLTDYVKKCTVLGHPEQTEEKMIAMFDPFSMMKGERKMIVREWLRSPVKIIDEINRLRPESMNILYELLQSGTVTYQGVVIKARPGPLFATFNAADAANYEIAPPVKDRFDVAVVAGSLNPWYVEMLTSMRGDSIRRNIPKISLDDPMTPQDLAALQRGVSQVEFPSSLMGRIAHFLAELQGCDMAGTTVERKNKGYLTEKRPPAVCADCTHYDQQNVICSKTENDIGTRTVQSIYVYSKALALWRGHSEVTEDDVKAVVPYATWFKINPTRAALDLDPRFVNDRIGLMAELYELAGKTYDQISNIMPEYKDLTSIVFSSMKNGSRPKTAKVEQLIGVAGQLDTPGKYPLITQLKKLYHEAR
ncbi:MAG: AAA family ATPase [Nanoarchaeota archaeon]|nr:AAA family ATPase [Nanoarchaeota archaeon]